MEFACSILLLVVCVGCSTPASRTEYYPVPGDPESGEIDGKQRTVTPMNGIEEGVYYFDAGLSKLVLELKNGHFRYWYMTDAGGGREPAYPVTGSYSANGATVELLHTEDDLQDVWTFRKVDGMTTLWRPNAVKSWHENRGFDFYGVLYATEQKPEALWKKSPLKMKP